MNTSSGGGGRRPHRMNGKWRKKSERVPPPKKFKQKEMDKIDAILARPGLEYQVPAGGEITFYLTASEIAMIRTITTNGAQSLIERQQQVFELLGKIRGAVPYFFNRESPIDFERRAIQLDRTFVDRKQMVTLKSSPNPSFSTTLDGTSKKSTMTQMTEKVVKDQIEKKQSTDTMSDERTDYGSDDAAILMNVDGIDGIGGGGGGISKGMNGVNDAKNKDITKKVKDALANRGDGGGISNAVYLEKMVADNMKKEEKTDCGGGADVCVRYEISKQLQDGATMIMCTKPRYGEKGNICGPHKLQTVRHKKSGKVRVGYCRHSCYGVNPRTQVICEIPDESTEVYYVKTVTN